MFHKSICQRSTKEGFSLLEQKERLEVLGKFKGYKIYDYYTDAGISTKTGNHRPKFDRLIDDVKNGKIQTLSNTPNNARNQLKDKNNKIKTLTENNEEPNLRAKTLNNTIKEKDDFER